jgi:uncharacterized protein YodC (DUF2158 family)
MTDKIRKGDVVRLRSGGSPMTVDKIEPSDGEEIALCSWFYEGNRQSDRFLLDSLDLTASR